MELQLSADGFIARGLHRECFIHPTDPNRCIKVIYRRGGERETKREIGYYRHLQKRLDSWKVIPRYHGTQPTDRGTGYVFDLVRDYDGNISTPLAAYLASEEMTKNNLTGLLHALPQLKRELYRQRIITMTIKSKNILYKKKDQTTGELIIVDNIGNSTLVPIANYIRSFAEAKIDRAWQRFMHSILQENADNQVARQLITECGL